LDPLLKIVPLESPRTKYLKSRDITLGNKSVNSFLIHTKERSYFSDCQGWLKIGLHSYSLFGIQSSGNLSNFVYFKKMIIENAIVLI
jgi:hypothetical protein